MNFVLENQFINRVDTWNNKWVDTWYHEYHKVCIISDVAIVYTMNTIKAKWDDVRNGIAMHSEYIFTQLHKFHDINT